MSDVILYSALKANQELRNELLEFCTGAGIDESFYESSQDPGYPYGQGAAATGGTGIQVVDEWLQVLTPLVKTNQSNGFKVCDTSGNFRCGQNCNWTVPSGVSRVQFQIWGPGAGTSGSQCCMAAPFGPSGAYMVVELDVSPGETYCMCAGCAYCCCASRGSTPGICGGPSWVRGSGLCMCADSGQSCVNLWNDDTGFDMCCQCYVPVEGGGCSATMCDWSFCYDTSNDNGKIDHAFSQATWYLNCADNNRNVTAYGLNGLWPYHELTDGKRGCTVSTPVFGFEDCVCSFLYCNACCSSPLANEGFLQIPGAGGYANSTMDDGCCTNGDHGRMGMVCISWECT